MAEEQKLPERPAAGADAEAPPLGPDGQPLSKNALKKLQKDKEKAEKAAKRAAEEQQKKQQDEANDISKEDYGHLPIIGYDDYDPSPEERTTLAQLAVDNADLKGSMQSPLVTFRATVVNAREQSAKLTFLVLGQRGQTIQAVVAASDTLSRQFVKFTKNIPTQSQVLATGFVKLTKEIVKSTTIGHLEIAITRLFIIVSPEATLPVQVEDCEHIPKDDATDAAAAADEQGRPIVSIPTRLDNPAIALRSQLSYSIFRIKHGVKQLFESFLTARGFIGIESPKMLGAASESGSSVFALSYFSRTAYLAQSPQFYKQKLIAAQFERVYEIGPVFRAENSNTARHLTEFTGLDLELAFERDYHEVVTLLEDLMLHIFAGLRTDYAAETALVRRETGAADFRLPASGKVPRLTFAEGVAMLRAAGEPIGEFDDISTPQEKKLGALVLDKYGTDFYVLDQYPLAVRPFYTMPSRATRAAPAAQQYSNSYDFMMRGQEILSGAQRIHLASLLERRMREMSIDPASEGFRAYVDAFRYACPPHAGAGLGLERIVMLWLGLPNIRLASAFPRDPGRLGP